MKHLKLPPAEDCSRESGFLETLAVSEETV
jgi:hypothetical protein